MADDPKGSSNGLGALLSVVESGFADVRGDLRLIHAAQVEQGKALGSLDSRVGSLEQAAIERRRRCSEEFRRLGQLALHAEDTGRFHLVEDKTRWRTLCVIGAVIVSLAGLIGTLAGLQNCKARAAAAPSAVDAARR